jgi:hypothetical protein
MRPHPANNRRPGTRTSRRSNSAVRYVGPRHIVIDDKPVPTPFWEPDRSFAGRTIALIGGGPSLAALDLEGLKGHRFIAINSSCRKVRPIATQGDVLYFTDNSWNENRPELASNWPGPVITANRNVKVRLGEAVRYLDVLALTERMGTGPDFVQASSGHIAACLAAVMGAARIVMVGFEARAVNGRTHGHNDYQQSDVSDFTDRFLPGWKHLAPVLQRMGVDVVNATPDSAITEFRFEPLARALGLAS